MLIFSFLLSYFVKLGVPFEKIPAILGIWSCFI